MGNTGLSQQRRQPANMCMFSLVSLFFCQQAVAYTKYTCNIIFCSI